MDSKPQKFRSVGTQLQDSLTLGRTNLEYSEPIVLLTEPNEPFLTLPLTIYPVTYNLINRRLNFRL